MPAPGLARLEVSINYVLTRNVLMDGRNTTNSSEGQTCPSDGRIRYKAAVVNYLASGFNPAYGVA
jgi:hypothetical protein